MSDPYEVLGLPPDSDDETIRRRYLELVRQFSPEHHPEKFAAVRAAYESLRDLDTRLRHRLFEAGKKERWKPSLRRWHVGVAAAGCRWKRCCRPLKRP